jgi:L-seryl-tRNA(Ser) seleniumtransferase
MPHPDMQNPLLRSLPSIDRMLSGPMAQQLAGDIGREHVRDLLRDIVEEIRDEIISARPDALNINRVDSSPDALQLEIDRRLAARAARLTEPSLRRVVNATGVIIHTNLGRAPLPKSAIAAVSHVASGYSNLEYDTTAGTRGHRELHCRDLIGSLADSEDAAVVNNNAAAVLLVLNTLADGGEVVVSRGELIEIGGSFRIPEVMEKSGARLREVGTTNRTRISDYQNALNENTRLILRVHPSNYRIVGFTERPSAEEIAGLAQKAGIPAFEDLGSGCLIDLSRYGINGEPVVADSLRAGISIVSFSGDKMLGGPQAGIIAGASSLVNKVRQNPLMRALRVDKLTYAALEATLRIYKQGAAESGIPVIRAIAAAQNEIGERAALLAENIKQIGRFRVSLVSGGSVIGGGSAPGIELPSVLVALEDTLGTAAALEEKLRCNTIPVIARVDNGLVLLDLRTVTPDEENIVLEALKRVADAVAQGPAYS